MKTKNLAVAILGLFYALGLQTTPLSVGTLINGTFIKGANLLWLDGHSTTILAAISMWYI